MDARPSRVHLFVSCLVDRFFPDTGFAAARVLERVGVGVHVDRDQTCCGQPGANAGFADEARAVARHTVDVLTREPLPVVVLSGSCADSIVHQVPALLADDEKYGPLALALAGRTWEFTQFLVNVLGVSDVGAHRTGRLAYHASCHGLRGLGIRREPESLLAHVRGASLVPLEEADTCCGFGGLFAVKLPEISGSMLDRKLACVLRSGADTIVTTDVSCAMHMRGALHRRGSAVQVAHIADVLGGAGA